jgi:MFS family permease
VRWLISTIRKAFPFRNSSFGLLWTGQLLSGVGTWLLVVAVPVYVFRITGSARDTGLATVAEVLPLLLLGPFAGVFADRWPRRRTMITMDVLRAGIVALLMLAGSSSQLWLILLAVFALSCCGAFFGPAYSGLVPSLVGRGRDLEIASAWTSFSGGVVRVAGAPLGGLLYALGGFRLPVVIDAASYLASALLVAAIRAPAADTAARAGRAGPGQCRDDGLAAALGAILAELRAGVAALRADRVLTVMLTGSALFLLGNGALTALLVPYVVADLGVKAASLGELFSALGVGYLLSAYLGRRACASPRLRTCAAGLLTLETLAYVGMFDIHAFASALGFICLVGLAGGAFLMLEQTLLQRRAPDDVIGRISSAYATVVMATTLAGALLASLLVTWVGRSVALNLGIAVVACGAIVLVRLPGRVEPARMSLVSQGS